MNKNKRVHLYSLLLLLGCLTSYSLSAQHKSEKQKWAGLQGVYYQSESHIRYDTIDPSLGGGVEYLDDHTHEFSLGTHLRWIGKRGVYHEANAVFQNTLDKTGVVYLLSLGPTQESGRWITERRLRLGYRFGVMVPLAKRLRYELGTGLFLEGVHRDTLYLNSQVATATLQSLRVGAQVYAGLNYRLHTRLDIGFHFPMVSYFVRRFRHRREYLADRFTNGGDEVFDAFGTELGWRNLRISYRLSD